MRHFRAIRRLISLTLMAAVTLWLLPRNLRADEEVSRDGNVRLNGKTPAERGAELVGFVATTKPRAKDETYPKEAAPAYAARLLLNVDAKYALEKLDAAVSSRLARARAKGADTLGNPLNPPHLDPFDKAALVYTYFLCKDKIARPTAEKIRDYASCYAHKVWKGYGAMNYRLMEDGSGYLAAEEWPGMVDADGLSANEIKAATRQRLFDYFEKICRSNFDEYGAPIYLAVDLSGVKMLAEFARRPGDAQAGGPDSRRDAARYRLHLESGLQHRLSIARQVLVFHQYQP